jgi:hypothetical protein
VPAPGVEPNRLGDVPMMLGGDGVAGEMMVAPAEELPKLPPTTLGVGPIGLGGALKMLGVLPTIGAAPIGGEPTLPMALPGVVAADGGAPTIGARPGIDACPKAQVGNANSAATRIGAASALFNIAGSLSDLR